MIKQERKFDDFLTRCGSSTCPSCGDGELVEVCQAGFHMMEHCSKCGRVHIGGVTLDLWAVDHEFVSASDYQAAVLRTANTVTGLPALQNWALGLTGEAGEVADIVKKHAFHGKPLDKTHLIEEVGDALWYAAMICNWLQVDMGEVMAANINKLSERYTNGFEKVGV